MVEILPPVTRLSVAPLPLAIVTESPLPIEKLCQLMMPVCDDWLTVRWLPPCVMAPLPPTKCPPVGSEPPAASAAPPLVRLENVRRANSRRWRPAENCAGRFDDIIDELVLRMTLIASLPKCRTDRCRPGNQIDRTS